MAKPNQPQDPKPTDSYADAKAEVTSGKPTDSTSGSRDIAFDWIRPTQYYNQGSTAVVPKYVNRTEAEQTFQTMYANAHAAGASRKQMAKYRNHITALGLYFNKKITDYGSAEYYWGQLLDQAESTGKNVYELLMGGGGDSPQGSSSGSPYGGGGSATPTVSAQNMHRLVDQTTQQYAGREATNAEAKAFTKQVRGSLSNPNMDPTFMAEEFAKNTPEATTYAANNYMKVFLQSLGGLGG